MIAELRQLGYHGHTLRKVVESATDAVRAAPEARRAYFRRLIDEIRRPALMRDKAIDLAERVACWCFEELEAKRDPRDLLADGAAERRAAIEAWRTGIAAKREGHASDWADLNDAVQAMLGAHRLGDLKVVAEQADKAEAIEYGLTGDCDVTGRLEQALGIEMPEEDEETALQGQEGNAK